MTSPSDQAGADAALESAIRANLESRDFSTGVLTDWLVVAAQQSFNEDGIPTTSITTFFPDGSLPMYRILGLLDYALTRYRAQVAAEESD